MSSRVAIVSSAATFAKRAGNAAYLASFCQALHAIGCRVDLLVLSPFAHGVTSIHQEADYLAHVDTVALRGGIQLGARSFATSPVDWSRATAKRAVLAADRFSRRFRGTPPRRPRWLNLTWPSLDQVAWARRRIAELGSDVVVANYFNAVRVFEPSPSYLRVILAHDVFSLRRRSYEAARLPFDVDAGMPAREIEAMATTDLCVTITPDEATYLEQRLGVRTAVFPFVTDVVPGMPDAQPQTCVFVGADNDPNRRAVAWLVGEVWPRVIARRPGARLRVVGTVVFDAGIERPPGVEVTGTVADLAAEYAGAAVAVVPFRAGSGLKIKLVEALAHGVPVVATSWGAAGVSPASTSAVQITDDPDRFAAAIVEELTTPAWRDRRARAQAMARAQFARSIGEDALHRAFALGSR